MHEILYASHDVFIYWKTNKISSDNYNYYRS